MTGPGTNVVMGAGVLLVLAGRMFLVLSAAAVGRPEPPLNPFAARAAAGQLPGRRFYASDSGSSLSGNGWSEKSMPLPTVVACST